MGGTVERVDPPPLLADLFSTHLIAERPAIEQKTEEFKKQKCELETTEERENSVKIGSRRKC